MLGVVLDYLSSHPVQDGSRSDNLIGHLEDLKSHLHVQLVEVDVLDTYVLLYG